MEVNIPRSNTDIYYRYKMPVINIKIEGKGNGIRTVITNMGKIMKCLDRPMEYAVKFIAYELGTKNKCNIEQDNCMFSGKHTQEYLSLQLDKFINLYILCKKCKNPETNLCVKNNIILSNCKACGHVSTIKSLHKISNFIIKTETNKTHIIENAIITNKISENKINENETHIWSLSTLESDVMARKQQLTINENIFQENNLHTYINLNPNEDDFLDKMNELKLSKCWSETILIKYIFSSLFLENDIFNFINNFYHKIKYLGYIVNTTKDMMLILTCLEKSFNDKVNIVNVINGFYEEYIVDEDIILKWYNNLSDGKIKDNTKPFIDWLKT